MLTHVHKVFAGLRWVWVRMHKVFAGLRWVSEFGAFGKMKCLFSIAPDAKFLVVCTFEQG